MNLVYIFKHINYYTSRGINLCYYDAIYGKDFFIKNGWNADQRMDLIHCHNGKLHREDGPAIISCRSGKISYWLYDFLVHVTDNNDFIKRNNLKVFW